MIDSVHDYPISQIFSKDANWYYCIPKYQREYTWSYSHWGTLFNDIESNALGYFIGSIICINNTHDSFQIKQLEVVDGQQRLTTLSILLAAIYTQLQKYKDYISDDDIDVLPSIRKSLRRNDAPNGLILQPQIQNYNSDDFSYLMQEAAILDVNKFGRKKAVSYYPQRKLGRCYNYYIQRLESLLKDIPTEEKVTKLLDIYNKINQAVFVECSNFLPTHDKLLKICPLHHHDSPQKQHHRYSHVGRIMLNLFEDLLDKEPPYNMQKLVHQFLDLQKWPHDQQ